MLQRELDLYLAPRWAGLLQCSSWGFGGRELRKAIEYHFLGIPAGYRLFTSENILASRKSKVIRELERIRAKLEYDIQRLMSSKVESARSRNAGEFSPKPAETGQETSGDNAEDTKTREKETSDGFSVKNGQVFYEGKDLGFPAGQIQDFFDKLIKHLGLTVTYTELQKITTIEKIRGYKSNASRILKEKSVPYEIATVTNEGYILRSKTES